MLSETASETAAQELTFILICGPPGRGRLKSHDALPRAFSNRVRQSTGVDREQLFPPPNIPASPPVPFLSAAKVRPVGHAAARWRVIANEELIRSIGDIGETMVRNA